MEISKVENLQMNRFMGGALIGSSLVVAVFVMTIALAIGGAKNDLTLKLIGITCGATTAPFLITGLAFASIAHWKLSRLTTSLDPKKIN